LTAGKLGSDPIFTRTDGGLWGKSHQLRPMLEACRRAKIKLEISFHVLRHTYGSAVAMKGVPMGVIAEQLGHADTRMTEKHYTHLAPSYVPTRPAHISQRSELRPTKLFNRCDPGRPNLKLRYYPRRPPPPRRATCAPPPRTAAPPRNAAPPLTTAPPRYAPPP
jgi:hypothetical protein